MDQKVGIVIVSYNASTAVKVTLASLRQAWNKTPAKVLLVDNASFDLEREKIRLAFERHVQEASLPWEYIQQEKNLGFSGGNNIGIQLFLEDPEISHICLLNADVVVTDRWLDHLIETGVDIVSAVTNKADSEQCVPVDYGIKLDECLDSRNDCIPTKALARIETFARNRYEAWAGNVVDVDVTFFCVLVAKSVFQKVGFLDETFFPGGFEDDDFCLRARKLGYSIHLARDVFVHHWGSASFGQLQYEYFNSRAQRNRDYLEKKHGITWRHRPEKPFISYLMDLRFVCSQEESKALQRRHHELYVAQLGDMLESFEVEFKKLRNCLARSGKDVVPALQNQIKHALDFGDLIDAWRCVVAGVATVFTEGFQAWQEVDGLLAQIEHIAEGIHARAECNFAMHALLFTPQKEQEHESSEVSPAFEQVVVPFAGQGRLNKLLWMIKRGVPFLWNLRGIVFFGGYPYPERQSDGYFQRIQIVDDLFKDCWRVYVESDELPGHSHWFHRPQPKVLVLRILGGPLRRTLVRALAIVATLKCRRVYFHSVLRMRDNHFGFLMNLPWLSKAIDIHGVVPEEFRFHNDFFSALLYEREERLAVRKSNMVIVVTEAMQDYLRQKYRKDMRGQVAIFPMFPNVAPTLAQRAYVDGKPVVVYAGGLHKWQQVPKMIEAISCTVSVCSHRFYCPDPDIVRSMLPKEIRALVTIDRKAHEELISLYAECHYGFILREDIVVNHVACPTKLVEYIAMGIVPIVDCEDIGDFKAMGMQFVSLEALSKGNLPPESKRTEMARQNYAIYERLREVRKHGAQDIHTFLTGTAQARRARLSLLKQIKGLLPANTQRGRVFRLPWRLLKDLSIRYKSMVSMPKRTSDDVSTLLGSSIMSECDVLVQVDNFEAGGLENVVLDLNDTLIGAGYKVVLLVLGKAGEAVKQARDRGMAVVIGSPTEKSYQVVIEQLKPRLLLTHYSLHGAQLCQERGIPFVQVIHNTYMWFNDSQRVEFAHAARFTSAFIAVSEYAKHYSVRRLGIEEKRCVVIPNGIDCAAFDAFAKDDVRREIRIKHGLGDDDFVFLSVGSINHQKNHIATVRAFSRVADKLPRAKLVILGPVYENGLLEDIEQFTQEWDLSTKVIYAGATPYPQKYYLMADAFVSAAFFEGGGLNHLEAARADLPSVMTKVGYGLNFEGITGFEVIDAPLDIVQFHGGVSQLVSTSTFEDQLSGALVKLFRDRCSPGLPSDVLCSFDKSNAYGNYIKLVEDLLMGCELRKNFPSNWTSKLASMQSEHCSEKR